MVRKKIDDRVRILIENGVKEGHRSLFVIVGDRGRDQVVNLHYILSKCRVGSRPSVLWCYKKELGFSSHYKKRAKQMKKMVAQGVKEAGEDDPFDLFISSTQILYTYYSESQKVMGRTFGMLVLQDFEALTPNLLARTIETVEGGGIIVLLLNQMSSLQQLYTMTMDVHARFRTEAHQGVVNRFNERFLLSLTRCRSCLICDDELNVLPVTSSIRTITPSTLHDESGGSRTGGSSPDAQELTSLKESLRGFEPVFSLISVAKSLEQARAILTFVDAISEKTLRSTVALTASRGRGKSAALGLAISAAVAFGYSNIFVTSPHPENLKTLFEFVIKGFDALKYEDHQDFEIVQSTNPEFNNAVVRINIHRHHRQTIQYIQPTESSVLTQAELVVIDEAAAIPLPLVKKLLGPYLVCMASTVNGYEGTGRSLSLKLLKQLREQSSSSSLSSTSGTSLSSSSSSLSHGHHHGGGMGRNSSSSNISSGDSGGNVGSGAKSGRVFRELTLETPIRYNAGDPIEEWLNELLCLDASKASRAPAGCPPPAQCDLYYVNRDTLFSFHRASETFLQRLVALFVASHYKNSPNDLQMMSDAPAHHIFVLLGPIDKKTNQLPDILCAIQIALEGSISKDVMMQSLARGIRAAGDLIPWTVSQQFQDDGFASLSGARIVRIATHPEYQRMGYGRRAMSLLMSYFNGEIISLDPNVIPEDPSEGEKNSIALEDAKEKNVGEDGSLVSAPLVPRANLPPLLTELTRRKPESLQWVGVSFGLTLELFKFWQKLEFLPAYLRLTPNEITGEFSCIMLRQLLGGNFSPQESTGGEWLSAFVIDFRRRFANILGHSGMRELGLPLVLSVLDPLNTVRNSSVEVSSSSPVVQGMTDFDLKRLEAYANNQLDYHAILDLLPHLCRSWMGGHLGTVELSPTQCVVLAGLGLQFKTVDIIATEIELEASQVMAQLMKITRKFSSTLRKVLLESIRKEEGATTINETEKARMLTSLGNPLGDDTLEETLQAGAKEFMDDLEKRNDSAATKKPTSTSGMITAEALDQVFGNEFKVRGMKPEASSKPRVAGSSSIGKISSSINKSILQMKTSRDDGGGEGGKRKREK